MGNEIELVTDCVGRRCGYNIFESRIGCSSGSGTCRMTKMLEADESEFHDAQLAAATQQIKAILAAIPPDPSGREISFVHTNMGTLLAWVEHGGAVDPRSISDDASDEELAAALGLRLDGYAQMPTAS